MTGPAFFAPDDDAGCPAPSSDLAIRGAVHFTPVLRPADPPVRADSSTRNTLLIPPVASKARARPIAQAPSMTLTPPTPEESASAPPSYATPSPPKYALVAADSETALLLAPPPPFDEPTRCSRCLESASPCVRCQPGRVDWVVRALIVLNLIVWGAVIWGYAKEWDNPNGIDWEWGSEIIPGFRGFFTDTQAAAVDSSRCSDMMSGGACGWAFEDC